mgnify:CR=1 FL=1
MSKSNKYGYSGVDIPTQAFQANVGKFDPSEINELIANNQWTQYGQLELIETKVANATNIDFTSIQESTYNVHFATYNNIQFTADAYLAGQFSNDGGSSFESGTDYSYGRRYGVEEGSAGHSKSASATGIDFSGNGGAANETHNGYVYFYNLGNPSKYSFATHHSAQMNSSGQFLFYYGGAVYEVAETINAIRFKVNTGAMDNGTISLYGIKEYI